VVELTYLLQMGSRAMKVGMGDIVGDSRVILESLGRLVGHVLHGFEPVSTTQGTPPGSPPATPLATPPVEGQQQHQQQQQALSQVSEISNPALSA